jgi:hypothetical protein
VLAGCRHAHAVASALAASALERRKIDMQVMETSDHDAAVGLAPRCTSGTRIPVYSPPQRLQSSMFVGVFATPALGPSRLCLRDRSRGLSQLHMARFLPFTGEVFIYCPHLLTTQNINSFHIFLFAPGGKKNCGRPAIFWAAGSRDVLVCPKSPHGKRQQRPFTRMKRHCGRDASFACLSFFSTTQARCRTRCQDKICMS